MIWATVSSRSCFCWLYRASPSLAAKNIINLILVLTSDDVHVWSLLLCCWKRVFAMTSAVSWQNSISLFPASFCTPRLNLPVTPGVSWLPTFAFQSPINLKSTINLENLYLVQISSLFSLRMLWENYARIQVHLLLPLVIFTGSPQVIENSDLIRATYKAVENWIGIGVAKQFFSRYFMRLKGFMENKSLALLSRDWICTRDRKGNYWLRNWKMAFKFSIFFPFKERKLGIFNYNPNASCLAVPKSSSLLESPILIIKIHTHTHRALHELWPPVENLESLSSPHHPPIISRILGSSCLISALHQVQYYCRILYPLWPKCKFVLLFASLQWHLSYTCWKLLIFGR